MVRNGEQRQQVDTPAGQLAPPAGAFSPRRLHVIHYGPDSLRELDVDSIAEIGDTSAAKGVVWINVDGLGNARLLAELGTALGFHPLALEDVVSTAQRPKVEDYPNHLLILLKMLTWDGLHVEQEQLSLFLCGQVVVSFQERPGDCFDGIRQRIRRTGGQIRQHGADYLAYAIIDAVVDSYFPLLEAMGAAVQTIEDEVSHHADERVLHRLHALKRDFVAVRHAVWPMRDAIGAMIRDEDERLGEVVRMHLRDCHDHAVRLIDLIEVNREAMGGLMDVYLSVMSNRLNEVMKVLTIISTLFMPLTFIAGVYGMNFRHMPELEWPWGYGCVLLLMLVVALVMLGFFWRRGWLSGGKRSARHRRAGSGQGLTRKPHAAESTPSGDPPAAGVGGVTRRPPAEPLIDDTPP